MKKLIKMYNEKYGNTLGVIDDDFNKEQMYRIYYFIKNNCDDEEIQARLEKIKLDKPKTLEQQLTKLESEHSVGGTGTIDPTIKNDIKNIKSEVNELNIQYKDIMNKIENGNLGNNVEPQDADIPKVFFSGEKPTSKTSVHATMEYKSKTEHFKGYVDIKCQGTSSMAYPKKNYTIKMFTDSTMAKKVKKDFKGWGKQSKFCLKANYIDHSHARNICAAKLWNQIVGSRENYALLPELLRTSPCNGAVDGFPIKVYYNNNYEGIYTWNIPKDKWMFNMDDTLDNHCVLCGEEYDSGGFLTANATLWSDEIHDTIPASIVTSFNAFQNFVINSTDDVFKANLENYVYVDSLIDYYIFQYAICGLDSMGKNQLFATYDGTKWIATSYDMDSTFGLYWNGQKYVSATYRMQEDYESGVHGKINKLYVRLEKLFVNEIKARYKQLRADILSYNNIVNTFEPFMDIIGKDLYAEDLTIYTGIPNGSTNNIQQIRKYYRDRLVYVDAQIDKLLPPGQTTACTSITLNKNSLQLENNSINLLQGVESSYVGNNLTFSNITLEHGTYSIENINGGTFTWLGYDVDGTKHETGDNSIANIFTLSESKDVQIHAYPNANDSNTSDKLGLYKLVIDESSATAFAEAGNGYYDSTLKIVDSASDRYSNTITVENNNVYMIKYKGTQEINIQQFILNKDGVYVTNSEVIQPNSVVAVVNNVAKLSLSVNILKGNKISDFVLYKMVKSSSYQLVATVTPTDTTDKVVWSVNPTGICTVENGVVTPTSNGQCTITATCGTKAATCNVTVNLPVVAVTALNLDKDSITLGDTTETDTSNINLLDGANSSIDSTDHNNLVFDSITLDAGVYVFRNINDGTFTYLGAKYDGKNYEAGNMTDEIMFKFDNSTVVQFHAYPDNKSTNTVDKLGLYKLGELSNPMKFTVAGKGYYDTTNQLKIDNNNDYSSPVTLDSSKKYVLMNDSDKIIQGNLCTWFINSKSGKNPFNIQPHSPIKLFENVSSLPVSINTTNNALSDLTLYEVSSSASQKYEDTLIATLTPANATNKNVTWTADNENVQLVPNGLNCTVKAKAVGNSVVTCTSQDTTNGTITDTCNVTVSNLVNVPTINYELAEPLVCDGTSTYKDTNIQLLSSDNIDRDWTMLVEFTPAQLPIDAFMAIAHCMNEQDPYPGIDIDISGGARRVVVPNNKQIYTGPQIVINTPVRYALTKQGKLFKLYNEAGAVLGSYEFTDVDIIPVDQTLLLGAYQDTVGNKGRYFNGTINKFKLVEEIYTVPQIKQYFGTVDEPIAYTLPQETTFNGTSDYVDTGIQLLKTDQDFTITMDVTADTQTTSSTCIMHCMKEQSPYRGIVLQSQPGIQGFIMSEGNNTRAIGDASNLLIPLSQRTKLIIVKKGTTMKVYNSNNIKAEAVYNFNAVEQTLLLGAYQNIDGVKGRFFKGTIHGFSISNTVYANEQINTYLGVNVATE